ncbi:MAG: SocA family protein [Candidatus Accumulibacter sp.]|jgi:uncharacterized phage-associated protein|nr:SocA family protein [Accumulibacter sp.]
MLRMIIKNPLFDESRAAQAAAYLLFRAGGSLPVIKIMKLLYLAERLSLQRYGEPLTGDKLCAMPKGPVLSMTLELINGANPPTSDGWDYWIAGRDNHMVALADPSTIRSPDDLPCLSEADIEVLCETWEKFGHFNQWKLVAYTHDKLPEWKDPDGSSLPISYLDVFRATGFTEETAQRLAARLETQSRVNAAFAA